MKGIMININDGINVVKQILSLVVPVSNLILYNSVVFLLIYNYILLTR